MVITLNRLQPVEHAGLGPEVKSIRTFIQQQDRRITIKGAGQSQASESDRC